MTMSRKKSLTPTTAELEILSVLWRMGATTVRNVHDQLHRKNKTGYTTVLKTMQIMHEKGLVIRNEENKAHVYKSSQPKEKVQTTIVKDIANRAFDGSISNLVVQALASKKLANTEMQEIRRSINALGRK